MSKLNRIANASNQFQGSTKKVLCVCSAGLLRSPTAAVVLSQPPFNYNTRAAGMFASFALVIVDEVLIAWADEIVCMEPEHAEMLSHMTEKPVVCLDIQDSFPYRDPRLMTMITEKYQDYLASESISGEQMLENLATEMERSVEALTGSTDEKTDET